MKTNGDISKKGQAHIAIGSGKKNLAIFLIAASVASLIATPRNYYLLVVLEGLVGLFGIFLFVYARIQFWREVRKQSN